MAFKKPSNFSIESFTEKFVKIRLNWDEILSINKLFFIICLNRLGIPTVRFPESFIKIGLDLLELCQTPKLVWMVG